jgi:hypothetical protein
MGASCLECPPKGNEAPSWRFRQSSLATVGFSACSAQEPIRTPNCLPVTFAQQQEGLVDSIIYLVGLVVVIMAILSFLGLR